MLFLLDVAVHWGLPGYHNSGFLFLVTHRYGYMVGLPAAAHLPGTGSPTGALLFSTSFSGFSHRGSLQLGPCRLWQTSPTVDLVFRDTCADTIRASVPSFTPFRTSCGSLSFYVPHHGLSLGTWDTFEASDLGEQSSFFLCEVNKTNKTSKDRSTDKKISKLCENIIKLSPVYSVNYAQ